MVDSRQAKHGARVPAPPFPTAPLRLSAREEQVQDYLPYAMREYDIELQGDGFAMVVGAKGAAIVLSDEERFTCGDDDIASDSDRRDRDDQNARNKRSERSHDDTRRDRGRVRVRPRPNSCLHPRSTSPSGVAWGALGAREAMAMASNLAEVFFNSEATEEDEEKQERQMGGEARKGLSRTMGVRAVAERHVGSVRPRSSSWGDE